MDGLGPPRPPAALIFGTETASATRGERWVLRFRTPHWPTNRRANPACWQPHRRRRLLLARSSHRPHVPVCHRANPNACHHRAHRTEDSAPVSALNILTGNALALFSEHFHIAGSRRDSSQSEDDLIGRALHQHKLHFSEVYGLRRDQSGRIFLKNDRLVFHEGE
jgi:hypothetical protein